MRSRPCVPCCCPRSRAEPETSINGNMSLRPWNCLAAMIPRSGAVPPAAVVTRRHRIERLFMGLKSRPARLSSVHDSAAPGIRRNGLIRLNCGLWHAACSASIVRGGAIDGAARAPLHAVFTREETTMLDNFRKRDAARSAPAQSPYGRMQEALSPASADAATPKSALPKTDPPRADAAAPAPPANKAEESVSKLIVGPDIKLKGAEITDCNTLVVEGRVEAAMESRVLQIAEIGAFLGKAG